MKTRWITCFVFVSLIVTWLQVGGCRYAEEHPPLQLKFSIAGAINSLWHRGAVKFSDLVRERTRGKLIVTTYPGSQLAGGDQLKELKMLKEGKIDFSYHSTLLYSNLDRRFFVVSMPWILSSYKQVDKFFAAPTARKLLDLALVHGIVGLAWGDNGFRQITNSKREIRTPYDLKGLRVRVPNVPMYLSIFKALGAEPIIMNFAAVYKALQEDVVDGQENPTSVVIVSNLHDVQKYITLWNYSYDPIILGVNRALFDRLDHKTQVILRQCAVEATAYQTQLGRERLKSDLDIMKEKGVVVTELTPEQVRAFRDKVKPVYAEQEAMIGKELLVEMQAIGK